MLKCPEDRLMIVPMKKYDCDFPHSNMIHVVPTIIPLLIISRSMKMIFQVYY